MADNAERIVLGEVEIGPDGGVFVQAVTGEMTVAGNLLLSQSLVGQKYRLLLERVHDWKPRPSDAEEGDGL